MKKKLSHIFPLPFFLNFFFYKDLNRSVAKAHLPPSLIYLYKTAAQYSTQENILFFVMKYDIPTEGEGMWRKNFYLIFRFFKNITTLHM